MEKLLKIICKGSTPNVNFNYQPENKYKEFLKKLNDKNKFIELYKGLFVCKDQIKYMELS